MKPKKPIITILHILIAIFILLLAFFIIPNPKRTLFLFVAVLGLIFLILGITLIVLAVKSKLEKKLKIFLILTGASAICPLVFSVLHNLFYALAVITENIQTLNYLLEFLHAAFFIIALLVSPIVFLIGTIGSIILIRKRKK